jgi:hypothetical protein
MGLKGYRLWVMGQLNSTCTPHHDVAVQVAFESKSLKPGNHLIGSRLKPGAFQLWVKLDSTCTAPPRRGGEAHLDVAVQVEFESRL